MQKVPHMHTVIVTAYAKAPQGSSMYEIYKYAGVILEIDYETNKIINADFTFISDLTKDYFKRMLIGYDLSNGIEDLVKCIETHYLAPSTNSVIVTLKAAYKRYMERVKKLNPQNQSS